ncbi:hypothetical protein [Chromobacterium sp. CV08]|uniref:hypothetical protein n=1 Tax=Chromobacterium sp. CV08 TaxID=3133274 RepID=UPI003DAA4892
MKLNNILSEELPDIDDSIKECVNFGKWLLFKSEELTEADPEAAYFLKVGSKIFELNARGSVLKTLENQDSSISIDELFYFSDIDRPTSLSNTNLIFH